jgi:predicted DNA-binding transcriptional regulator AlpA
MRILSVKETCQRIGKGRTKLWQLTRDRRFPATVRIDNGIGYLEHEVDAWIAELAAKRDAKDAA